MTHRTKFHLNMFNRGENKVKELTLRTFNNLFEKVDFIYNDGTIIGIESNLI